LRIAIVGVCCSGKTTLAEGLRARGFDAYTVAQEHSGIKRLWRKKDPDVLIMLDAALSTVKKRCAVPWGEERLAAQRERLKDAKENAHLFISTDLLSKEEVVSKVLEFISLRFG